MSNEGALATLNDDAAIAEIASGILSKTIADRYNVTPWAVRKRLAKHPDYPQAVKDQAESLVEQAIEYVMTCDEKTVAIARVRADTALKYAAARDSATWGQKQAQITINNNVLAIGDSLVGQAGELLNQLRMANAVKIEEKP